jgi:cytochrome c oxidase assembly protein subunit 15
LADRRHVCQLRGRYGETLRARGPFLEWLPRFPERPYRIVALAALVSILLLIGTGGWVRLSGSGLGCPTWPKCYGNELVAHATYHSLVEFMNRCVITAVAILIGVAGHGRHWSWA